MRNSDFILFFFIIYDLIISMVYLKFYFDYKEKEKKKDIYINDLENELEKARRK